MRLAILASIIALASSAQGQIVTVGPPGQPDPHYCDRFTVEPNFTLEQDADVSGRISDASGAPFRNSPVELRAFVSPSRQVLSLTAKTDADGNFQMVGIEAGKYRLIASPTRAFQQSAPLRCVTKHCDLVITLKASPTDQMDSQCPVR
jgi:hypothetical protein